MTWRNLHDQTFDYAKIEEQFLFKPIYLDKRILKVFPIGIFRNIRQFKPDIVLVPECGFISLLTILYKKLTNAKFKVISMIDDSYDMISGNQFSKKHEWAEKLLIPHFDNVINVDLRTALYFQDKYSKGVYFPIIYDEVRLRERYQQILPISEKIVKEFDLVGKKIILFVGRMVGLKNISTLITVFKRIHGENYRLILVGNGDVQENLIEQSRDDNRILYVGRYEGDELFAWYNFAHIFCLPSIQEAFGAVTGEALLGGCWCLISDKAGSQCIIKNGYNGMVFNPKDEDSLYYLLTEYLEKQRSLTLPLYLREDLLGLNFRNEIKRLVCNIS